MSGFPPPPSPGSYANSRQAWKAQRRAMKAQARLHYAQLRMQRRAMRRRSIVGPLVLLIGGVLFLMAPTGNISLGHLAAWYESWWPMVLIAAGLVLLLEWAIDSRRVDAAGRPIGTRTLGGGVIFLLIVMAFVGTMLRFTRAGIEWKDKVMGPGWMGLQQVMGDEHDSDDTASSAMAPGAMLLIRNPHGDVTVTGSSTDGQVHVSVHKQVWAWKNSDADDREKQLQPTFSVDGNHLVLNVAAVQGGQADLSIEVPKDAGVTLQADHGDVTVSNLQAAVSVTANHGDVDLSEISGEVTAHVTDDDASFSAHNVTGGVSIEGRAGDINISDIGGDVSLQGDFFGTTDVERVKGAVRFESSRTQFEVTKLDGEFEVAGGPDLSASNMVGPVVVKTKNRNITLDGVSGTIQITNRNGSVDVTQASPLASIEIANQHGSVDVGLPAGGGFDLNATTKHGEMENDYGLEPAENDEQKTLNGSVAGGGPAVTITTSDGDVTIRKSTVAPAAPPAPPPPSKPNAVPEAPRPPAKKAPKAPAAPKPPASVSF